MNILRNLIEALASRLSTGSHSRAFDARNLLESRSAFLVQKSISEYSQARANMLFSSLLREKSFQDAYEIARWRAFPAGLSMVAEVMFHALRRQHADAAAGLTEISTAIVQQYQPPPGEAADYWTKAVERVARDLARAALGEGRAAHLIARDRAKEIFDALPFHPVIKKHDFDMFRNTLSFHLAGIAGEIEDRGITL